MEKESVQTIVREKSPQPKRQWRYRLNTVRSIWRHLIEAKIATEEEPRLIMRFNKCRYAVDEDFIRTHEHCIETSIQHKRATLKLHWYEGCDGIEMKNYVTQTMEHKGIFNIKDCFWYCSKAFTYAMVVALQSSNVLTFHWDIYTTCNVMYECSIKTNVCNDVAIKSCNIESNSNHAWIDFEL